MSEGCTKKRIDWFVGVAACFYFHFDVDDICRWNFFQDFQLTEIVNDSWVEIKLKRIRMWRGGEGDKASTPALLVDISVSALWLCCGVVFFSFFVWWESNFLIRCFRGLWTRSCFRFAILKLIYTAFHYANIIRFRRVSVLKPSSSVESLVTEPSKDVRLVPPPPQCCGPYSLIHALWWLNCWPDYSLRWITRFYSEVLVKKHNELKGPNDVGNSQKYAIFELSPPIHYFRLRDNERCADIFCWRSCFSGDGRNSNRSAKAHLHLRI